MIKAKIEIKAKTMNSFLASILDVFLEVSKENETSITLSKDLISFEEDKAKFGYTIELTDE